MVHPALCAMCAMLCAMLCAIKSLILKVCALCALSPLCVCGRAHGCVYVCAGVRVCRCEIAHIAHIAHTPYASITYTSSVPHALPH